MMSCLFFRCQKNAPVIMSSPHFYQNPDYLRTAFDGISPPNPDDHETRLYIEPTTGMSIKINKRIQVRILAIHQIRQKINHLNLEIIIFELVTFGSLQVYS